MDKFTQLYVYRTLENRQMHQSIPYIKSRLSRAEKIVWITVSNFLFMLNKKSFTLDLLWIFARRFIAFQIIFIFFLVIQYS